ncbi:MAG: hypothetical protein MHMPM18_003577, partial [Marteilia pararefringens]
IDESEYEPKNNQEAKGFANKGRARDIGKIESRYARAIRPKYQRQEAIHWAYD